MSENFSKELINSIILGNKHIVNHRNESFGVNDERIKGYFQKLTRLMISKIREQELLKKQQRY
jgi:hypothetical protein